jgi:hypothetical protein
VCARQAAREQPGALPQILGRLAARPFLFVHNPNQKIRPMPPTKNKTMRTTRALQPKPPTLADLSAHPAVRKLQVKDDALREMLRSVPHLSLVTLTVNRFEDVLTTRQQRRDTPHTMKAGKNRYVRIKPESPHLLSVTGRCAHFFIRIKDMKGAFYTPFGLVIKPVKIVKRTRPGLHYQMHIYPEDKGMFLSLDFGAPASGNVYEFFVAIKRESDHTIGIIDPGIEHER